MYPKPDIAGSSSNFNPQIKQIRRGFILWTFVESLVDLNKERVLQILRFQ